MTHPYLKRKYTKTKEKKMELLTQKFIPEGWNETKEDFDLRQLQNAKEQGTILQGLVKKCDENCNLQIHLGENLIGIISQTEIDSFNQDDFGRTKPSICKNKVGQFVQFKVKEICNENRVILSRKEAENEALDWAKNELEMGMVVNGIVKNIRKFGVFVDIGGGVTGLLHIEDISVSRIKSPEERFFVGQKIKVMIKSVDRENNRIVLSHKELLGNWEDNVQDFQEKMIVGGIVKEADQYKNGLFIELTPNLVGLAEYKDGFRYGQKVKVYIKKIIKDKKKIKLLIV